jgi:hypothetical protein
MEEEEEEEDDDDGPRRVDDGWLTDIALGKFGGQCLNSLRKKTQNKFTVEHLQIWTRNFTLPGLVANVDSRIHTYTGPQHPFCQVFKCRTAFVFELLFQAEDLSAAAACCILNSLRSAFPPVVCPPASNSREN